MENSGVSVGDSASGMFMDGSLVSGVVERIDGDHVYIRSSENNRLYDVRRKDLLKEGDDGVRFRYAKRGNVNMSERAVEALDDGLTDVGRDFRLGDFIADNGLGSFDDEYHHVGKDFNKHYFVRLNDGVTLSRARKAYKEYLSAKGNKEVEDLLAKYPNAISLDEVKARGERIWSDKDPTFKEVTYANGEYWYAPVGDVPVSDVRFRGAEEDSGAPGMDETNRRFNEDLDNFTEDNALSTIFNLGNPSDILLSAGIVNKPIRLYGSKVLNKMKKHGFKTDELRSLPGAVANPIAVFNNIGRKGNRSVLTELKTANGNFLVTIDLGKEIDADFDIVSSVFGKSDNSVLNWINKGLATYMDKERALDYLRVSAPIAEASNNQELLSATKIVESFVNPTIGEGKSPRLPTALSFKNLIYPLFLLVKVVNVNNNPKVVHYNN